MRSQYRASAFRSVGWERFAGQAGGSRMSYIHRIAGDADIYFVSNQRYRSDQVDCPMTVQRPATFRRRMVSP